MRQLDFVVVLVVVVLLFVCLEFLFRKNKKSSVESKNLEKYSILFKGSNMQEILNIFAQHFFVFLQFKLQRFNHPISNKRNGYSIYFIGSLRLECVKLY